MLRSLFAICILVSGVNAIAQQKTRTAMEGAGVSGVSTVVQGGIAWYLKNGNQFFATELVPNSVVVGLTDENIQKIINSVDDQALARFGVGNIGGAKLTVKLNETQLSIYESARAREATLKAAGMAEADAKAAGIDHAKNATVGTHEFKANMQTRELNVIKFADNAALKAQLEAIRDSGAGVASVELRGVLQRVAGTTIKGTLIAVFAVGATSNGVRAIQFASQANSAVPQTWTPRESTGYTSWLFNTADAVYYYWSADQTVRQ